MATFKVALLALFLAFSATFLSVFSTSSPESHQQQDWLKEAVSEVESSAAYSSSETVEVSYKDLKKVLKKIIKCEKAFSKYRSMQFPLCHHPHLIFYFTVYTISTNVETMGKHEMSPRRCTTHKFCVVVFLLTLCKQSEQKCC